MLDEIAAKDPIHRLLNCLIQRGVSKPRSVLTEAEIRKAVEAYRPDLPVWPQTGTGTRTAEVTCPTCGKPAARRHLSHGMRRFYCRGCHRAWREEVGA